MSKVMGCEVPEKHLGIQQLQSAFDEVLNQVIHAEPTCWCLHPLRDIVYPFKSGQWVFTHGSDEHLFSNEYGAHCPPIPVDYLWPLCQLGHG